MAGVNKVILIGNLGADPELRYTPSGTPVVTFRMATTERWRDKEGNLQDHTEWHRIVAWGKLAETCGEWLKKGSQVYIEGRLRTRSWEDRNGNRRYTTEIRADTLRMLGRREEAIPEPPPLEEPPEELTPEGEEDLPF